MKKISSNVVAMFFSLVCLQACGSGNAGVVPLEQVQSQVQKTAVVTFATATSDPTAKLRGVIVEAVLPEGLTVTTDPGTTTISSGVLKGEANQPAPTGIYTAATRTVRITVVTFAATDIAIGTFAKLTCNVASGYTLTASQFTSIIPVDFQVTGPLGADLTAANPPVISAISATFGY